MAEGSRNLRGKKSQNLLKFKLVSKPPTIDCVPGGYGDDKVNLRSSSSSTGVR